MKNNGALIFSDRKKYYNRRPPSLRGASSSIFLSENTAATKQPTNATSTSLYCDPACAGASNLEVKRPSTIENKRPPLKLWRVKRSCKVGYEGNLS